IITSNGVQEAPNTFSSLKDCQIVSSKLKVDSYCVQKQSVDIDKQMSFMVQMLGKMKRQMDEEFAKNN
ncbi:MAG: hypothetical protein RJA41_38, partial [Actinomycetota bacterium]